MTVPIERRASLRHTPVDKDNEGPGDGPDWTTNHERQTRQHQPRWSLDSHRSATGVESTALGTARERSGTRLDYGDPRAVRPIPRGRTPVHSSLSAGFRLGSDAQGS
jgi:hypothetical protein